MMNANTLTKILSSLFTAIGSVCLLSNTVYATDYDMQNTHVMDTTASTGTGVLASQVLGDTTLVAHAENRLEIVVKGLVASGATPEISEVFTQYVPALDVSAIVMTPTSENALLLCWVERSTQLSCQHYNSSGAALSTAAPVMNAVAAIEDVDVLSLGDNTYRVVYSYALTDGEFSIEEAVFSQDFAMLENSELVTTAAHEKFSASGYAKGYLLNYVAKNDEDDFSVNVLRKPRTGDDVLVLSELVSVSDVQLSMNNMSDRTYSVVWSDMNQGVLVQRIDGNGKKHGSLIHLSTLFDTEVSDIQMHALKDGNHLISWTQDDVIKAQLFTYHHETIANVFQLSQGTASNSAVSAVSKDLFISHSRETSGDSIQYISKLFIHDRSAQGIPDSPIADAGPNMIYHGRDTVYLNGTGSVDSYGYKRLKYDWKILRKPEGSNANVFATLESPSFYPDKIGEYVFELTVINRADGQTNSDVITFQAVNNAPIANAGDDKTVSVIGSAVQLSGRNSYDVDDDYLWYEWSFKQKPANSAAALDNVKSPTPRFVPDMRGTYVLELVARDAWKHSEPATVTIDFDNQAPTASLQYSNTLVLGEELVLDGSDSHDSNQDPLQYIWTVLEKPEASALEQTLSNQAVQRFVPDAAGLYRIEFVVSDGSASSQSHIAVVNVAEPERENTAPVAVISNTNISSLLGSVVQLDGRASHDAEDDQLFYRWEMLSRPAGSVSHLDNIHSPTPRFQMDQFGLYIFELVVNDGELDSAPARVTVTMNNLPPQADAGLDITASLHSEIVLGAEGSNDPNGEVLTYEWTVVSRPAWSVSEVSDPNAVQTQFLIDAPGIFVLELSVTDSNGAVAKDTVIITVENTAPIANAGNDSVHTSLMDAIALSGASSHDPDGMPLSYRWAVAEEPVAGSADIDNAHSVNALLNVSAYGQYVIQLIVSDGLVDSVIDQRAIRINNDAPVADAGNDLAVELNGELVVIDGSGSSDVNGDTLVYSWVVESRPENSNAFIENADMAQAQFMADVAGTYVLTLSVDDGHGLVNQDSVVITVSEPVVEAPEKPSQDVDPADHVRQALALVNALELNDFKKREFKKEKRRLKAESNYAKRKAKLEKKLNRVLWFLESDKKKRFKRAHRILSNGTLKRIDGCSITGAFDKNDWVANCDKQMAIENEVRLAIEVLEGLMK